MGRKKKVSEEELIAFGDGQTHLEGRKHKKWSKRYGKKYDKMVDEENNAMTIIPVASGKGGV